MSRLAFGVALVVLAASLCAQRRLQSDEVHVPGTDITLRAGWQLLFFDGCRYAVPLVWRVDDGAFAYAPDGGTISIQRSSVTNWLAHKADLRHVYGPDSVIHEDSERRLWIESRWGTRILHHIAVLSGATVCTGVVELPTHAAALHDGTLARIADLIGLG